MWLFLACAPTPQEPDVGLDSAAPIEPVPLEWGVTTGCESAQSGGFDAFYADGVATLVAGDDALGDQVEGWYGPSFNRLKRSRPDELTDEARRGNLFLVGSPQDNALLAELDEALPARFEDDRFTFGGYRYANPGDGVAFVHPNPFGDGTHLLLHVGNTSDGALATFTVPTGQKNYQTVHGRGVAWQKGNFCQDQAMWTVDPARDKDSRADWEAWAAGLEQQAGTYAVHHYPDDSDVTQDPAGYAAWHDTQHLLALDTLELDPLDRPIDAYYYATNADKGAVTGVSGNAHANDLAVETHTVYGPDVHAGGAHEDVHVLAWHRIGPAQTTLMGEGLAVRVDDSWWGEPLDSWVSEWKSDGTLLTLRELIDDFWAHDDALTYPTSGHFVRFLHDTWGMDTVKALYVAPDLDQAFEDELGMTTAEVEAAWLGAID